MVTSLSISLLSNFCNIISVKLDNTNLPYVALSCVFIALVSDVEHLYILKNCRRFGFNSFNHSPNHFPKVKKGTPNSFYLSITCIILSNLQFYQVLIISPISLFLSLFFWTTYNYYSWKHEFCFWFNDIHIKLFFYGK